jgi:hypothetical protein
MRLKCGVHNSTESRHWVKTAELEFGNSSSPQTRIDLRLGLTRFSGSRSWNRITSSRLASLSLSLSSHFTPSHRLTETHTSQTDTLWRLKENAMTYGHRSLHCLPLKKDSSRIFHAKYNNKVNQTLSSIPTRYDLPPLTSAPRSHQ